MDGLNYSTRVVSKQQAKNICCQSSSANPGCHRGQPVELYRDAGNPADIPLRGLRPRKLLVTRLWWNRPAWLERDEKDIGSKIR